MLSMTQDVDDRTPKQKMLDSINSPILKALDDQGVTLSYLAKLLKKELRAKHIKTFLGPGGAVVYSDELDALEIQQKARQDAHKLRGDYPAEKHDINAQLVDPRTPEEREALIAVARRLSEELRKKGK